MPDHSYTIQPGSAWVYDEHVADLAPMPESVTRPSGEYQPQPHRSGRVHAASRRLCHLWSLARRVCVMPAGASPAGAGAGGLHHLSDDEQREATAAYAAFIEAMDEIERRCSQLHRAAVHQAICQDDLAGVVAGRRFMLVQDALSNLADFWCIRT